MPWHQFIFLVDAYDCQRLFKMVLTIENPAGCEVRFFIRFLCAKQSIFIVRSVQCTEKRSWVKEWYKSGSGHLKMAAPVSMMRSAVAALLSLLMIWWVKLFKKSKRTDASRFQHYLNSFLKFLEVFLYENVPERLDYRKLCSHWYWKCWLKCTKWNVWAVLWLFFCGTSKAMIC